MENNNGPLTFKGLLPREFSLALTCRGSGAIFLSEARPIDCPLYRPGAKHARLLYLLTIAAGFARRGRFTG